MESEERRRPPIANEVEVSLFGPGIGECLVIHLGQGDWIVVDSCIDPSTKNPAALDYLNALGLDPAVVVREVIITHWHNDHMRGVSSIIKKASAAKLGLSAALRIEEFQKILGASETRFMEDSGVDEIRDSFKELLPRRGPHRVRWLLENTRFRIGSAELSVLSPSSASYSYALEAFRALLPVPNNSNKRRFVPKNPNNYCVAIHLSAQGVHCILGADLERGQNGNVGWRAVVNSEDRPQDKAILIKIPHHGSEGANEERVWSELLEQRPISILTPFRSSHLPKPEDQQRIAVRSSKVFLTASPNPKRPQRRDSAVEKIIKRVAPDLHEVTGEMGHVRLRWKADQPQPNIEVFGQARELLSRP